MVNRYRATLSVLAMFSGNKGHIGDIGMSQFATASFSGKVL